MIADRRDGTDSMWCRTKYHYHLACIANYVGLIFANYVNSQLNHKNGLQPGTTLASRGHDATRVMLPSVLRCLRLCIRCSPCLLLNTDQLGTVRHDWHGVCTEDLRLCVSALALEYMYIEKYHPRLGPRVPVSGRGLEVLDEPCSHRT